MKVRKSIVFDGKMGMRKFWSVALPFGKVACAVKVLFYNFNTSKEADLEANQESLFDLN